MKKAKEYAEQILAVIKEQEEGDKDQDAVKLEIGVVFRDINLELEELYQARNIKRGEAMMALIDEQNRKWNAIVKRVNEAVGDTIMKADGVKVYFAHKLKE